MEKGGLDGFVSRPSREPGFPDNIHLITNKGVPMKLLLAIAISMTLFAFACSDDKRGSGGDADTDGDIDGLDLAGYATGGKDDFKGFADNYGRKRCFESSN